MSKVSFSLICLNAIPSSQPQVYKEKSVGGNIDNLPVRENILEINKETVNKAGKNVIRDPRQEHVIAVDVTSQCNAAIIV